MFILQITNFRSQESHILVKMWPYIMYQFYYLGIFAVTPILFDVKLKNMATMDAKDKVVI